MAIITKTELMNQLKTLVGDDTSDNALNIIGDLSDTLDDMEKKANGGGEDWEKKYKENDAMWRQKYKDRFFNGLSSMDKEFEDGKGNKSDDTDELEDTRKTTYESLFEEKKGD